VKMRTKSWAQAASAFLGYLNWAVKFNVWDRGESDAAHTDDWAT
jgi:hypothetical protein